MSYVNRADMRRWATEHDCTLPLRTALSIAKIGSDFTANATFEALFLLCE